MADIFEILFGNQQKPVRRDANLRRTVDADGNPIVENVGGESIALSKNGSIDRINIVLDRFYHCGCNAEAPMGGQCSEPDCRRISCKKCFGRCTGTGAGCLRPLCLEHSKFVDVGQSNPARLCRPCAEAMARKKAVRTVVLGLLSPFVEFKEGSDQ